MTNFSQRHQESQLLQSCYSLRSVWWLWLNTVCKCFVVWLKSTHRPSEEVCRVSASKTAPVLCSDYFHLSKHHFREECGSEVGTHSYCTCDEERTSLRWQIPKSYSPLIWLSAWCHLQINHLHVNSTWQSKYLQEFGWYLISINGLKWMQQYLPCRLTHQSTDWTLSPLCPGEHITAQDEKHPCPPSMACDIFSRLEKCVSLPFFWYGVQTPSLALNNPCSTLLWFNHQTSPWRSRAP